MADPKSGACPASFNRFLDKFCSEVDTTTCDEDDPPLKVYSLSVLPSEVEAECLNWVLQYLSCYDCPKLLAPHIARAVYVHLSKLDLSQFYIPEDDDIINTDEEDAATDQTQQMSNSDNLKPQIPQIDASRLLKEVLTIAHDVCKQWQQALPPLHISQQVFETSTYAIKNTRRKMEDVHIVIPDLNSLYNLKDEPAQSFYAVYDGHGGVNAAVYSSCHLHTNIIRDPHFCNDTATATKRAYTLTDERFTERAKKEKLRSGTTCITMLIRGSTLHVSWLGDSQAVLVKNGQVISLMEPHKPEREDERSRIEALGGCVIFFGAWRVNGNIAVSRAIGDISQKPFVCSDADVVSFDMDGGEDYLVLACDGVWDVLQATDIPNIVYTHVKDNNGNRTGVAKAIVEHSRDSGSNDNISVVVVFFRDDITEPQGRPTVGCLSENGMDNYKLFDFGDGDRRNVGSSNSDNTGLNNGTRNNISTHGKGNKDGLSSVQENRNSANKICHHGDKRNVTNLNKAATEKSSNLSNQIWGSPISSYNHSNSLFVGQKKWPAIFQKNKNGRRKNTKLPKIRRLHLLKDMDCGSFSHPLHTVSNHRLNLAAKNSHPSAVFRHTTAISDNMANVLSGIFSENAKKSTLSSVSDVCSLPYLSANDTKRTSPRKELCDYEQDLFHTRRIVLQDKVNSNAEL